MNDSIEALGVPAIPDTLCRKSLDGFCAEFHHAGSSCGGIGIIERCPSGMNPEYGHYRPFLAEFNTSVKLRCAVYDQHPTLQHIGYLT